MKGIATNQGQKDLEFLTKTVCYDRDGRRKSEIKNIHIQTPKPLLKKNTQAQKKTKDV